MFPFAHTILSGLGFQVSQDCHWWPLEDNRCPCSNCSQEFMFCAAHCNFWESKSLNTCMCTGFLPLVFSPSDTPAHTHSLHRVGSCKPSPLPPTSLPFCPPHHPLPLTLTYSLRALFQASIRRREGERVTEVGGEGPADRIWSSSACGENDLEDSETESGIVKHSLEYTLFFQALIFVLEWRRCDWKKTSNLWTLKRANKRKLNAGIQERRTRKYILAPSPELS